MDGHGALVAWDSSVRVQTRLRGGGVAIRGLWAAVSIEGCGRGRPRSRRFPGAMKRATSWQQVRTALRLGVLAWENESGGGVHAKA